jgi:hypothetical protein
VYIYNDKSLFIGLKISLTLGVVRTSGGPISLQGIGTVKIEFLIGYRENVAQYSSISLTNTLYILGFPLNIVSGRSTLIKEKLYTALRKVVALLNIYKSGFFFTTKSAKSTKINPQLQVYGATWHCYSSEKSDSEPVAPTTLEGVTQGSKTTEPIAATEPTEPVAEAIEPIEPTAEATELISSSVLDLTAIEGAIAIVPTTALSIPSKALVQVARL